MYGGGVGRVGGRSMTFSGWWKVNDLSFLGSGGMSMTFPSWEGWWEVNDLSFLGEVMSRGGGCPGSGEVDVSPPLDRTTPCDHVTYPMMHFISPPPLCTEWVTHACQNIKFARFTTQAVMKQVWPSSFLELIDTFLSELISVKFLSSCKNQ